jgi:hypothetical protein
MWPMRALREGQGCFSERNVIPAKTPSSLTVYSLGYYEILHFVEGPWPSKIHRRTAHTPVAARACAGYVVKSRANDFAGRQVESGERTGRPRTNGTFPAKQGETRRVGAHG